MTIISKSIFDLSLDTNNFRTVGQKNEINAIHALIAIDPDRFWALMESLIDEGYHPTENIIVLESAKKSVVMEGNRRVAALKIAHGMIRSDLFELPSRISAKISGLSAVWKKRNLKIPCAVYGPKESAVVDKIVSLIHGKGELASRANWSSVARARHGREKNGETELGLDLLEKYLSHGSNHTEEQAEKWAGEFPLTVLDEALSRLAPRFGFKNTAQLVDSYPKSSKHRKAIDLLILNIGLNALTFSVLRNAENDFALAYGAAPLPPSVAAPSGGGAKAANTGKSGSKKASGTGKSSSNGNAKAVSLDDPKAVARSLRTFSPRGNHRAKLVTLLKEIRLLKIDKHPHAFCFLLRSMFEISAKAYCKDHAASSGPKAQQANGDDRKLVDILRDVVTHLTKNKSDKVMQKAIHGAITQLAKHEGILSVTSMNQLVHNPKFSVHQGDICELFGNIFPLLEEMNK